MSQRVMVTGGAGFIGSHLVEGLLAAGAAVVVLDDLSSGDVTNFEGFGEAAGERLSVVKASILDAGAVLKAAAGCAVVYHLAALGSVPGSVERPRDYHDVNVTGTLNVLEAARGAGVGRVVLASSSSVYGASEVLPKVETMAVEPASPYAATKAAGEALVRAYAESYGGSEKQGDPGLRRTSALGLKGEGAGGLDGVSLRFFNVYGPRQSAGSQYAAVIAAFAGAVLAGRRPQIYGDGLQSRDFVYVTDVVQALMKAGTAAGRLNGEVINVANGRGVTVNELAAQMASLAGRPELEAEHQPERGGDVKHSVADIAKAGALLGFEPGVGFEEGLGATVGWYGQQ